MAKTKVEGGSQSPYVKYNKSPYSYTYKNCAHKSEVHQSTGMWRGTCCGVCNIIIRNFNDERDYRR